MVGGVCKDVSIPMCEHRRHTNANKLNKFYRAVIEVGR